MEPRFGWDFSRIRVHADSRATESACRMSARAYTAGQNIVFDSGQYAPATADGQRLLAHELTHVVQQQTVDAPAIQRQAKPAVDIGQTAAKLEQQAVGANQEREALKKLEGLEMADLLKVSVKLYDDWVSSKGPDPMITMLHFGDSYRDLGTPSAWALLSIDLFLAPPSARTAEVTKGLDVSRLRAAFDAARVHKQRNPKGEDKGTSPTHAGARDLSKLGQPARPGDWGEDKWGNTWVMHEGTKDNPGALTIRTYWKTEVAKERRSSQWLGKNVGNFGYNPAVSKRAIGSFQWGKDFRAIYLREEDAGTDIRENMSKYTTVGDYIDKGHLGPTDDRKVYYDNIQRKAKVKLGDSPAIWVKDDNKWAELFEGFRLAEGWVQGTEVTAQKIKGFAAGVSPNSPEAEQVAYYATLLGVSIQAPATTAAPAKSQVPGAE